MTDFNIHPRITAKRKIMQQPFFGYTWWVEHTLQGRFADELRRHQIQQKAMLLAKQHLEKFGI